MSVSLIPADRVCAECAAILQWAGLPARGQYRHVRSDGQMYITTHAPAPRASMDDETAPKPAADRQLRQDIRQEFKEDE